MSAHVSSPADAVVARVQAQLSAFLAARAAALAEVGPELADMAAEARRFVLDGGKRLRPQFAYWGWRATRPGTDDDTDLVIAAASLELLHGCALVHDDVMDASATRRGRPASHVAFAQLHRDSGWRGDPAAFGTAAAILLGDLLLSWADAMFMSSAPSPLVREAYDRMRELVLAGQYLDVLVQARGGFSVEDALRVAEFKTGKYTVEGPLHLGAAAAGSPPETFVALSGYGVPLGEAFQLRDDVLGVFGDPEVTGKPAGDDLREGKRTLLVALAMRSATAIEAQLLRSELGDRAMDEDAVAAVREVIVRTGALDEVEKRIAERAEAALAALDAPGIGADSRAALAELATAATRRHT
ncbi:MAG: polyprenyl synthetase family protein [Jatrophihabitans sp.]|nr:MAG: polyprenyl synthetase family protein [Jatrophihabitans sp.]